MTASPDGSGWLTVRHGPQTGVVPTSYVEQLPGPRRTSSSTRPMSSYSTASSTASHPTTTTNNTSSTSTSTIGSLAKKIGPAVAPRRGAKKVVYVTALYDYDARSEAECSMREGERFVLVNRDAGDGWADVEKAGATRSVPANYLAD